MPTESIENYLKTIFVIEESFPDDGRVSTKQIADALGFSQASVSGMIRSLADAGFVSYERYKGVKLSEKGRAGALSVLRKHRLIEMLLVELFQYSWDEVHEEAEFLEHAVSDRLASRIDEFLGYPNYDPHGDPIPSPDGSLPQRDILPLSRLKPGCSSMLARVMTNEKDFLQYLHSKKIHIGTKILVHDVQAVDGQMELIIDGENLVTLSPLITSKLFVVTA